MALRGKNISFEIRQLIVFHHAKGRSYKQLSELFNVKKCTVQKIVRRFNEEGRIDYENAKAGRPRILNKREERRVIRKIKLDPKVSAPNIASQIAEECEKRVNPETIRRIIRREGYNGRIARKKPFINERNRKIRLQFAREHYLKEDKWWHDIIFCDESKFNVFGSDGRTMVWRKPNQ